MLICPAPPGPGLPSHQGKSPPRCWPSVFSRLLCPAARFGVESNLESYSTHCCPHPSDDRSLPGDNRSIDLSSQFFLNLSNCQIAAYKELARWGYRESFHHRNHEESADGRG